MPTFNDLYDPGAAAAYERHAAERKRLGQLLYGEHPCPLTGQALREARAAHAAHKAACEATFETRAVTVEEYARWRFSVWCHGPAPAVDWAALGSVEEVNRLASRLEQEACDARRIQLLSLPVGQPAGLAAFGEAGRALRYWRHFTAAELTPGGWARGSGSRVLVTADPCDGVWHVCFTQDPCWTGLTVTNGIELLAGAVYREALLEAERRRAGQPGLRGWLAGALPPAWRPSALGVDEFRFYEHLSARARGDRESFDLVRLHWEGGRFWHPRWERHPSVPRLIAAAREEVGEPGGDGAA